MEFLPGEIHGVLGMNGAGKSTFFNSICGLKSIDSGECLYHNKWVNSDQIAFMQTHTYFYPYMQGIEYLNLIGKQNPDFDPFHWNKIFELPLYQLIENYSTGMKKKLVFMGVLAQNRPILILDEPFNGVDIESNEKIIQILEYLRDKGSTILLSSHIIHSLTDCCDKVSYLKNGQFAKTYLKNDFKDLQSLVKELVSQDVTTVLSALNTP
ncbi:ABC transporter ATP-binding protein [Aureispira anguillae]|uniref:ABC transporter ATP-binding protein n=2 Tax=Aureispira anguillae TaxID=2864201 RepID=A0A916DWV4_9BACT|nr:ABC transporter ATP-binding protein [Aureispira anguillae]